MQRDREDPKAWLETTFRRIMCGFSFRDPEAIEITTGKPVSAERRAAMQRDVDRYLDPEIYVRALTRMGIQVLHHHAKNHGGVSCYATKVGHRFSLMGERDFFGELVTACRKAGIVPGAMYQVGMDRVHAAQHPEWLQMDATGKRCTFTLCPNNREWRSIVMAQTEEIAHYDIGSLVFDELLLDWHNIGTACYCPHCRRLFQQEVGDDIPEQEDWDNPLWSKFVLWRYEKLAEFIEEADAIRKRVNPDIALTSIYKAFPINDWKDGWDADRTAPLFDFLLGDVGGASRVGFRARWYRALSRHRPELACDFEFLVGSYTHYHYVDKGIPKPRDMCLADVMTALANGATPAFESVGWSNHRFWDKRKATMCAPVFDEIYREATREIERREPWLVHTDRLRHAMLLHSRRTRDFRYHSGSGVEPYKESFWGWHSALLNGQVLYDMGTEARLNAEDLPGYSVLVLANAACLSDEQAEAIRQYVRAGGGLVASFCPSLFDETGKERADFALADVLGVSYQDGADTDYILRKENPAQRDQYFLSVDEKHKFFDGVLVPGQRMTCPAPMARVTPRADARPLGRITIYRHEGGPFEGGNDAISGRGRPEPTDNPVLVTNRFGKGRSVYLAGKFAASYRVHAHPLLHKVMLRAVRWAGGRPTVEVDAPPSVEVNAYDQPAEGRRIVHLVNYQAVPMRAVLTGREPLAERILPVHGLMVTARVPRGRKVRKVYLAPDKKRLKWTQETGSRIRITVPEVHIHGMVVVEYA